MTLTSEQARAAALALMAQHPCEYARTDEQVAGDVEVLASYIVSGDDVLPERVGSSADLTAEFDRLVVGVGVDPSSDEARAALRQALDLHRMIALSSPGGVMSLADAIDMGREAALSVAMPADAKAS
ncbi:hypothetical protein ACUXK4_004518 [Methylorubrum extorquens]